MTRVENFLFIYFFCTVITYYIIEAYRIFFNHNSTKQNKMVFIVVVAIYLGYVMIPSLQSETPYGLWAQVKIPILRSEFSCSCAVNTRINHNIL